MANQGQDLGLLDPGSIIQNQVQTLVQRVDQYLANLPGHNQTISQEVSDAIALVFIEASQRLKDTSDYHIRKHNELSAAVKGPKVRDLTIFPSSLVCLGLTSCSKS